MKINSMVFTAAMFSIVAIAGYHVGVSGRNSNQAQQPLHTVVESDSGISVQQKQIPQKDIIEIPNQQQSVTSKVLNNPLKPQAVTKQTEAIEAKTEPCIPNYQSKNDNPGVLTGTNVKPPAPGYLTGPSQPVNRVNVTLPSTPMLPPSSQNAVEDFDLRYKLYMDIAKTEYDNEIANAENNPLLVKRAQQRYTLSVAKIQSWHRRIENAFRMINLNEKITDEQKQMDKDRLLNTIEEPMYVPKRIELSSDEPK